MVLTSVVVAMMSLLTELTSNIASTEMILPILAGMAVSIQINPLLLMLPATIGLSATQLNIFINTNFAASCAEGSVSWLNYAFRLVQLPIGLFFQFELIAHAF